MKQGRGGKGLIAPVVLILLGGIFLAQNTGVLPEYVAREGWPLLLVAVGVLLLVRRLVWRRVNQRGTGQ
ncbi:DUF5668 domain-containing protein [Cupriavidus basilensis]|uniref:DUF5668 domain-containing protein n=1 Tax=Cupriavidus basilensis TaxID=68895 RepID=A0ABT6AMK8_9BURK|nr:DUF5668 domain-containing protein [Cupriavidus basilensis]MDF3833006.1 DUF5668 domain-containing protein [Cupriavidus basilensis]